MKTYKEIENSRNRRLWITQVGIPAVTLAVTAMGVFPEAREAVVNGVKTVGNKIANKMKKKEKKAERKIEERDTKVIYIINDITGEYRTSKKG